jgi:hypothetical protein
MSKGLVSAHEGHFWEEFEFCCLAFRNVHLVLACLILNANTLGAAGEPGRRCLSRFETSG